MNSFISFFFFIPKFFNFLYFFRSKNRKNIRPYFGIYLKNSGGPYIRTKRLISYFGNYFINPNIIYAQSFWSEIELKNAISYSKKNDVPIIFNQNGLYYKGWFKGDYKKKNELISLIQKDSKFIFFQSIFCKESSIALTKFKPSKYKILYNSIPNLLYKSKKNNNPKVLNIIISGYFNEMNFYIIEPAINVIYKMAKRLEKSPRLIIYGLKKKQLNSKLKKKIQYLEYKNKVMIMDNYNIKNISLILKNIHLALHLKYKDPCPNSVLERMHYGIPHIISHSGGTPELTGNSSINIKVRDTWKFLVKVDEKELYNSIIIATKKYGLLKKRTYKQIKKFNWKNYVSTHEKIFKQYVS